MSTLGLTHIGPVSPRCESLTDVPCVPLEDWRESDCLACLYTVYRVMRTVDEVNAVGDRIDEIRAARDRVSKTGVN